MRDNRILSTSVQVDQEQDNAIDSPYHSQLNSEAADSSHQRERYNVTVRFKRLEHVSETSLLYICFVDLMYLVAVLLSIVPTLFVLFVCLPLGALLRYLIYLCSLLRCWLTTGLGSSWQLASTLEEIWLCDTRQHQASQVLITLHSPLCVGDLREYINTKLVMATSVTGQRLYPRFTQKVKRLWCDSLWVTDELFDINNHVYENDSLLTDLKTHVGQMANIPLSLDRPLWEMQLIKYLDEQLTESYGILFRVHPAFADGTVLVHILTQVLTDRLPVSISSRRCVSGMYVWKCIKAFFSGFISCLHQWLFRVRDRNSLSRMLDGQKKLVSWSKPISLEKICRIRQVTRTTVTDVLLAISTQILCKYLKNQHGGSIVHIHATVPMEVRSYKLATDAVPIMGSSYAFVDMLLPTNVEGIIPKLWHIKSRSDALKKSSVPLAMHTGAWMLRNIFPLCLFKRLFRGILNQSSCFVSSLNTIETRLSIASSQVTGVVCFLPSPLESRLSFSFVTYAGEIYLAITADGNIISSLDAFTEEFSSQVCNVCLNALFYAVNSDLNQLAKLTQRHFAITLVNQYNNFEFNFTIS